MSGLIWSLALAVIGIAGLLLAGQKNKLGWALGLFAQLAWIAYALISRQYGFILSAVAYGIVYSRNWLRWRREERAARDVAETELEARIRG